MMHGWPEPRQPEPPPTPTPQPVPEPTPQPVPEPPPPPPPTRVVGLSVDRCVVPALRPLFAALRAPRL